MLKINLKTLITSVVLLVIMITLSMLNRSYAFTLSPSSGTLTNGGQATISVIAGPSGTTNSVYVHIAVPSGMTVTNFTPSTSGPNLGGCTGSVYFLAQEICAALGHGSNLTAGQVLGTFTITSSTNGSYDLTAGVDAEYGNGQVVSGTLGSYTVATSGQTLPTTSIFSDENRFLLIGMLLIILGLIFMPLIRFNIKFINSIDSYFLNRKRLISLEEQKNFEEKVLGE